MAERLRGRAGQAQRLRRLRQEPLCRSCHDKGVIRIASEVDHIVPFAQGGQDIDVNCQSLCVDCHAYKTAFENASSAGAAWHPDWLKPSSIPLTIVCGPPCSGKSTYIAAHAGVNDLVIDLDHIMRSLDPAYTHWSNQLEQALLNKACRIRNTLLGGLSSRTTGRAWFIVAAPTQAERDWWLRCLGGQLVLLDPGPDECKLRAIIRDTPLAKHGVDDWYRASRQQWRRREHKPVIRRATGVDGWPVD